jgi:hypothetical protein
MAEMSDLEQAMRKRLLRMIEDTPMQGAPAVNVYAGGALPSSVSEALSAGGGMSTQKQMAATQAGISPEELEYLVDISKRDVKEQVGTDESGEPIYKHVGWDKKVHRYTMPAGNTAEGNRDRSGLADWTAGGPNTDQPGDTYAVHGDSSGLPSGPPKKKRKPKDTKGLSLFTEPEEQW